MAGKEKQSTEAIDASAIKQVLMQSVANTVRTMLDDWMLCAYIASECVECLNDKELML